MTEIKVKDLESQIKQVFDQKEKYDIAKKQSTDEYNKFKDMQQTLLGTLDALDKESYKSDMGLVSKKEEVSYSVPQDLRLREDFFSYLKQKGVYKTMITVHSRTLNAFAKEEHAAADNAGELDFKIPGLGEPKHNFSLTMRRNK